MEHCDLFVAESDAWGHAAVDPPACDREWVMEAISKALPFRVRGLIYMSIIKQTDGHAAAADDNDYCPVKSINIMIERTRNSGVVVR